MVIEITKIRTIRVTKDVKNWRGKTERTVSYFSGYDKKASVYMNFCDDVEKAEELNFETPEEEFELLHRARKCSERSSFEDQLYFSVEWVDLEVKKEVTSFAKPVVFSEEASEMLKTKLIKDLTPLEIKVLGLQNQAVYLKLRKD